MVWIAFCALLGCLLFNVLYAETAQGQEKLSSEIDEYAQSSIRTNRIQISHVEGPGIGYHEGYTSIKTFLTSRHESQWMPFWDLRAHLFNNEKLAANMGGGVRYRSDKRGLVFGANAFLDYRKDYWHALQVGIGAEVHGGFWSFYLNGYIPVTRTSDLRSVKFHEFKGHKAILQEKKKLSMGGLDAFANFRLFTIDHWYLDLGAGPYWYQGKFGKDTFGGKGRLIGGYEDYLYTGVQLSYDRLFKCRAQCELGISFPLGPRIKNKTALDNSWKKNARKMITPIIRQEIIVMSKQHRKITARDPISGNPLYFVHVNNLFSNGNGTFEHPFGTLLSAQKNSSSGNYIYVNYGTGSSQGMDAGIVLQTSQHLLGSGNDQLISTTKGNITIPALTPGSVPMITNINANSNGVVLANGTEVGGFNILGATQNGIFASNLIIAPYIHDNVISDSGTSGTSAAIYIAMGNNMIMQNTFTIINNILTSNVAGAEGMHIECNTSGISSMNLYVVNNKFVSNTTYGLHINLASASTSSTISGTFQDNIISGNGTGGVLISPAANTLINFNLNFVSNVIAGGATVVAVQNGSVGTLNFINNIIQLGTASGLSITIDGPTIRTLNTQVIGNQVIDNMGGTGIIISSTSATGFINLQLIDNVCIADQISITRSGAGSAANNINAIISGNEGVFNVTGTINLLP